MRERDWSDQQESQQHDTEASGTRGLQAIENSHSRSVVGRPLMGRASVTMGLEKSAVKTIRTEVWIHLVLMKATTGTDQLGAGSVVLRGRGELSGPYNPVEFQSTKGIVSRWGHHLVDARADVRGALR